jgi:hypothetical protein
VFGRLLGCRVEKVRASEREKGDEQMNAVGVVIYIVVMWLLGTFLLLTLWCPPRLPAGLRAWALACAPSGPAPAPAPAPQPPSRKAECIVGATPYHLDPCATAQYVQPGQCATAQDCCEYCALNKGCVAATFNSSIKDCHMCKSTPTPRFQWSFRKDDQVVQLK